jgi:hypothetical protein
MLHRHCTITFRLLNKHLIDYLILYLPLRYFESCQCVDSGFLTTVRLHTLAREWT